MVKLARRMKCRAVRLMLQGKNDEKSTVKPTEGGEEQGILPQGLMRFFSRTFSTLSIGGQQSLRIKPDLDLH